METEKTVGPSSSLSYQSPSFTTYSSQNLSDIAARVVSEFNFPHNDPFHDDFYSNDAVQDNDDDEESEFEFAVLCGADNPSPISADEIFSNGQIKPTYPLFDTNLVFQDDSTKEYPFNSDPPIRLPLHKLLIEERENNATTSCSSSDADELEGVPPDTYCVWAPKKEKKEKKNGENENDDVLMRKKSKSTGSSSKRWRIRDLLYRSNSDGKDTFVFLSPNHPHHGGESKKTVAKTTAKKFHLPYRQDLVGFFANANGISRTVRPF